MVMTDGPMAGTQQKMTWKGSGSHVFVYGVNNVGFARKGVTKDITVALTTQDVKDKVYIGTLRDGTATIKFSQINFGDTTGQLDMFSRVAEKAPIETILYLDAATKVTFDAIVTDFTVDEPIEGVATGSATLQISGAITPAAV